MATKKATPATTAKPKKTTASKPKTAKKVAPEAPVVVEEKYVYAVGRRKTAVAQVRLYRGAKATDVDVTVNGRPYADYFKTYEQREAVIAPLKAIGKTAVTITVHVMGGGHSGQADAVKLGIARALITEDALHRPLLKAGRFLTRDPRAVERKKPGLKKARRAPQWAKR